MSGFDFWRNEGLAYSFATSLDEAKGLPSGWVSKWGDKKAQKQVNGSWAYVPNNTPEGLQPISAHTSSGFFHPTQDDEITGYLKSINFDDPKQQAILTGSPKFVGDMLKKFGAGWFDKYKKANATPATTPAVAAATPVPPPVETNPVDSALATLGYSSGSPQAFAVAQLHKLGSHDAVANVYSKQYKMKFALAYHEIEALIKKGSSAGVFGTTISNDDLKVKFLLGKSPVVSAPVVAVSAPVSATPSVPVPGSKADIDAFDKAMAANYPDKYGTPVKTYKKVGDIDMDVAADKAAFKKLKDGFGFPAGAVGAVILNLLCSNKKTKAAAEVSLGKLYPEIPKEDVTKMVDLVAGTMETLLAGEPTYWDQKGSWSNGHPNALVNFTAPAAVKKIQDIAAAKAKVAGPAPEVMPEPIFPPTTPVPEMLPSVELMNKLDLVHLYPAHSAPVLALLKHFGVGPDSNLAKAIEMWRTKMKVSHTTAAAETAYELGKHNGSKAKHAQLLAMMADVQKSIYQTPDWDWASFSVNELSDILKNVTPPVSTHILDVAAALGYAPDSGEAKILDILPSAMQEPFQTHTGLAAKAVSHLQDLFTLDDAVASDLLSAAKEVVKKLFQLPNFNTDDFKFTGQILPKNSDARAQRKTTMALAAAEKNKFEPLMKVLGFEPGSLGAITLALLYVHSKGGESNLHVLSKASEALINVKHVNGPTAVSTVKNVQAKLQALKSGMPVPVFTDGDEANLKFIKAKPEPKPEPEPLKSPMTSPAALTTPVATPVVDTSSKPVTFPAIPPLNQLAYAGDAKVQLGGNKPKKFLKDSLGNMFLHKYDADQVRAQGGAVASSLAALITTPGVTVPVVAVEVSGDWGTVQPMLPNVSSYGLPEDVTKLGSEALKQLQRERVIDWVISNHDAKKGNFVQLLSGQVFGIDKEQAFKNIGKDALSLDYQPNPSEPIYNSIYGAFAKKELQLDLNDALPTIQAIEAVSDAAWSNAVMPYIMALPKSEQTAKMSAILSRKKHIRKDFETFFSSLTLARGEGEFKFADPKVPSVSATPAGMGVLAPLVLPSKDSMKYLGVAKIGGAGEKHFYQDDAGQKWLIKLATNKSSKKPEPWKVAAQVLFSTVAKAVKPSSPAVGATDFKGQPATIQPWLGDGLTTLSDLEPVSLSFNEKKDVATEHVLDWLLSQHDTHGGQLMKLKDGSIIGIDKEQGFKYMMPNPKWTSSTPNGDVLSVDYHPNAQYGEQEPYYNKFWKAFSVSMTDKPFDSIEFDPTVMKDTFDAIEKIPDAEYVKALEGYASAAIPDAVKAGEFYAKALSRKQNIRAEFETFITGLYEKRTKKKGKFTFAGGWIPEGTKTVPAATAQPLPTFIDYTDPKVPVSTSTPAPTAAVPTPAAAPPEKAGVPPVKGTYFVPPPEGFIPPDLDAIKELGGKVGIVPGSVYFPALSLLAKYKDSVVDAASQLAFVKSVPYLVALKRVKFAKKKLLSVGGWASLKASTTPVTAPSAGPVTPAIGDAPAAQPAATLTPVAALNPSNSASAPTTTMIPIAVGALGNQNVKVVTPTEVFKPKPPPPPPPVPAGFDPPEPGKMWEVKPASAFFGTGSGGHLYKTKPPKDPEGNPDLSSPNLLAKFVNTSPDALEAALKTVGANSITPPKVKGDKVLALFAKTDWEAIQKSDKQIGIQVDLPPPPPPPSGKFLTTPQAGQLQNAPAVAGIAELKTVQSTLIGAGVNINLDGPAVEHHSMGVTRHVDAKGEVFYRFSFKLREPVWSKLKGFNQGTFTFNREKYDSDTDAFKFTSNGGDSQDSDSMRKWSKGKHVFNLGADGKYCNRGRVFADVYAETGKTPFQSLTDLMSTVDASLPDTVLRDTTASDRKLMGLSALYWSIDPQGSDSLPESSRTIEELTSRIKKKGYTQETIDSIRFEKVGIDQTVPVLPGRSKKIQEQGVSHISVGISSTENALKQLRGGTVGINARLAMGLGVNGATSSDSDQSSGGAEYVFTMPGKKEGSSNGWGDIEMVYDPSEFDRLDGFQYSHDGYGKTQPGSNYDHRKPFENGVMNASEIMFRQGLNANKLLKIRCNSGATAAELIAKIKKAGITQVNGMTPEELVVASNGSEFYKVHLQPAGY